MINPSIPVISGSGRPRLILVAATNSYVSGTGTTYTPSASDTTSSVTEADGSSVAITSSSAGTDQILTGSVHGLAIGDYVVIAGHTGSTPSLNGKWKVLDVPDTTHFKIVTDITVGGTSGTVKKTPAFALRGMAVGRRVLATPATPANNPTRYGKIIAIDDTNNKLTVDAWVGGTPTAGDIITVNGWIADLPYCNGRQNKLVESFEPAQNVIPLWRYFTKVVTKGYLYSCVMDYSEYISGDTLILLRPMLNKKSDERLVLIPRSDVPAFSYNVYLASTINIGQTGRTLGHSRVAFQFVGTELSPTGFSMVAGYGTNYGNSYGVYL